MNNLEKRLDHLESTAGKQATRYAIVPVDFIGTLPPGVIGICTGVPRHDDDPSQFRILEQWNESRT